MITKRASLLLALLAIIGLSTFVFLRYNKPTPAERLDAEQEIYSLLLLDQRNAYSIEIDEFQIVEYTNSGELRGNTPTDSAGYTAGFDTEKFPDLKQETWVDFQEKNKTPSPIKDYLPATADIILVNPSSVGINSGTNSEQFYWWVSFSRIGFNSSLSQALVLVGDCRGESCYESTSVSMYSSGFYVFLEKGSRGWVIKKQQDVWHIEAPSP